MIFCFIASTGCSTEGRSDNSPAYVERCWTIIDDNTGVPISTAHLNVNYTLPNGIRSGKYLECDEEGKACGSFVGRFLHNISGSASAPGYFTKIFDGYIPDVIRLTPSGK